MERPLGNKITNLLQKKNQFYSFLKKGTNKFIFCHLQWLTEIIILLFFA